MSGKQLIVIVALFGLGGCAVAPNARHAAAGAAQMASVAALTDAGVQREYDRQPLVRFPATIAVAQISGASYYEVNGRRSLAFSAVGGHGPVPEDAVRRLAHLPLVEGVTPLESIVLPNGCNNEYDLRQAAASLHADLLLLYAVESNVDSEDLAVPVSIATVGLFPNQDAKGSSKATAILMDVRNGYIYAVAQATAAHDQVADFWTIEQAENDVRRRIEKEATAKLLTDFERAWGRVVTQYAAAGKAG